MDSEQYKNGYAAGLQEGRSLERDKWMPKYDNLLNQFQNALVEASQCKRWYERYKELLDFYLGRTEFSSREELQNEKLLQAYAHIENLERAHEVLQDVVAKLMKR